MSLILFPFKLAIATVTTPLRIARIPVKVFGYRGAVALGLGVAIGVLVAPRPGAETRQRLLDDYERWRSEQLGAPDLAAPDPTVGVLPPDQ